MIGGLFGEMSNCFSSDAGYELYTFVFLFIVGLTLMILSVNSGRANSKIISTYVLISLVSFVNLLYLLNCYTNKRHWTFFFVLIPVVFVAWWGLDFKVAIKPKLTDAVADGDGDGDGDGDDLNFDPNEL